MAHHKLCTSRIQIQQFQIQTIRIVFRSGSGNAACARLNDLYDNASARRVAIRQWSKSRSSRSLSLDQWRCIRKRGRNRSLPSEIYPQDKLAPDLSKHLNSPFWLNISSACFQQTIWIGVCVFPAINKEPQIQWKYG